MIRAEISSSFELVGCAGELYKLGGPWRGRSYSRLRYGASSPSRRMVLARAGLLLGEADRCPSSRLVVLFSQEGVPGTRPRIQLNPV